MLTLETIDLAGQCVQTSIIPAIATLRERHRLTFSSLFSPHLLVNILSEGSNKGLDAHLDISADMDISDAFFNSMTLR
jgi:hypothetical protein